jgi:hypothetical protein
MENSHKFQNSQWQISNLLANLEKDSNIFDLFSLGLYHKYENVNRVYLDTIIDRTQKNIETRIYKELAQHNDNEVFMCLLDSSENEIENPFHTEEFNKELRNLSISLPTDNQIQIKYNDDDEMYEFRMYFFEEKINLKKYIQGILSRSISNSDRYLSSEVFILFPSNRTLFNLYDDRGFDTLIIEM